ncbi:MAG: DUF6049 family protein [Trueperella sp.]|nr:DUF6049 family protein [Trueperella sp.]
MKKFVRILVVFLACSVLLLGALGTMLPAALAAPPQDAAPETESAALEVTITGINTPVLEPGADLVMTVRLTNQTNRPIDAATLSLATPINTFVTASHMQSWMAGQANIPVQVVKTADVAVTIPAGKTETVSITVPAAETPWPTSYFAWGPRGIAAEVATDVGDFADRSLFVVGPDAELHPTDLAIVAPISASLESLAAQPTFAQILGAVPADSAAAEAEDLSKELTTHSKHALRQWDLPGVTLAVDPQFSTEVGLSAKDFTALEKAKVALLPAGDVDLSALIHTERSKYLSRLITSSREQLPHYQPNLEQLLFLPVGPVDGEVLAQAYASQMLPVIADADAPPAQILSFTPHAHGTISVAGESRSALFSDAILAGAARGILQDPVSQQSPVELDDFDAGQALIAISAAHFRQRPNSPRGSVLTLPRGQVITGQMPELAAEADSNPPSTGNANAELNHAVAPEVLLRTVKSLSAAPWVNPVPLAQIAATPPDTTARQQLPNERVAESEITQTQIAQVETATAGFHDLATIFTESAELLAAGQQLTDSFFAAAWNVDPARRAQKIAELETSAELAALIRVENSSPINMISETSALPLQITNPFNRPANVQVKLITPDIRLQATDSVTATLPAGSTKTVSLPVTAHGSGNMEVEALVLNEAGTEVGASQKIPVRVRADWENTGIAIFAALVFAVLIFGIAKSIRAGRRSQPVALADFTQNRSDGSPADNS